VALVLPTEVSLTAQRRSYSSPGVRQWGGAVCRGWAQAWWPARRQLPPRCGSRPIRRAWRDRKRVGWAQASRSVWVRQFRRCLPFWRPEVRTGVALRSGSAVRPVANRGRSADR